MKDYKKTADAFLHVIKVLLAVIVIVALLCVFGCAYTPIGKVSANAFIAVNKGLNGGELTFTEEALRQHENGEIWGTVKNAFYNLLMAPIDIIWTGRPFCHGQTWRHYEETGEAVCK